MMRSAGRSEGMKLRLQLGQIFRPRTPASGKMSRGVGRPAGLYIQVQAPCATHRTQLIVPSHRHSEKGRDDVDSTLLDGLWRSQHSSSQCEMHRSRIPETATRPKTRQKRTTSTICSCACVAVSDHAYLVRSSGGDTSFHSPTLTERENFCKMLQ